MPPPPSGSRRVAGPRGVGPDFPKKVGHELGTRPTPAYMNALAHVDLTRPAHRTCERCSCRLARDNDDIVCSPCRRHLVIEQHFAIAAVGPSLDDQQRFAEHGVRGLAEDRNVSLEEAVTLALNEGLLPKRWRAAEPRLRHLVTLEGMTHVEAAEVVGVSRWTIATWRDGLGLQAKRKRN